jgi:BlaI family transcriptional regulator, penicillinase repressor
MNNFMMTPVPTDAELDILQVLWEKSPETVRFVNDELNKRRNPDDKEIGYTTTLKIMQLMLDKGLLTRDVVERSHIYKPSVSQEVTQTQVLRGVVDTAFGGSASTLVMRALGSGDTKPEDLAKIKALIQEIEAQNKS